MSTDANEEPTVTPEPSEATTVNDIQSIIERMSRMPMEGMHPETIPRDLPEDSAFSKAVLHWRYLQREYGRRNGKDPSESELTHPEPDINLFHDLSVAVLNHVQRLTAIKYAVQDAGFNIMRRGVTVDLKTDALRKHLEDLEGLRLTEELATLMGLGDYKSEITLREVDKLFGSSVTLVSEQRRQEAEQRQFQGDMHNLAVRTSEGIKEIAGMIRNQSKSYGGGDPAPVKNRRRPDVGKQEPRGKQEQ